MQDSIITPGIPPRKPLRKRWSVRILAALVVFIAGVIAISSAGGSHAATSPRPAPSHSAPASPVRHAAPAAPVSQAPATQAPAAQAPATQAPAAQAPATQAPVAQAPAAPVTQAPADVPTYTVSQQQALTAAQSYLSDGQGFSRAGLISQLSSSAGGQFSVADATWAVDNSGTDWDAQAVIAAKGYLSDGQGFSRQALIDQLTSPYGGQFTYAEAVYGVTQAGL